MGQKITCPDGFFCQTSAADPYPTACPIGYYYDTVSAGASATAQADCVACDAGQACLVPGSSAVTETCSPGFVCNTATTTTSPLSYCADYPDVTNCEDNFICPRGYYCPNADDPSVTTPAVCPQGTFSSSYGLRSSSECIQCIEGYICDGNDVRTACSGGYYCPPGTFDLTGLETSPGYFTEAQYPAQVKCIHGTYSAAGANSADCTPCDAGSKCTSAGLDAVTACDPGYDCSSAGTIDQMACFPGQYSSVATDACADSPED
jgi:hypothetical protein